MLRDNGTVWDLFNLESAQKFLWQKEYGPYHPSRLYVMDWIKDTYKDKIPTLLDIPCGAGVDYENLKDMVSYHGMDKTNVFVDGIKERFKGIHASKGDIRDIPLEDQAVDIVYARAIFEHLCDVQDVALAMAECYRVAKDYCIFSFFIPLHDKETEIDWNGKYFNNKYNRKEITDTINRLKPQKVSYKHIEVDDRQFIDSYDIFILKK